MRVELYKDGRKANSLKAVLELSKSKLQDYFKRYTFEGVQITELKSLSSEMLREALEAIIYKDVDKLKAFGDELFTSALNSRKRKVEAEIEAYRKMVHSISPSFNAEYFLCLEGGEVNVYEDAKDHIYYSTSIVLDHPMAKDVVKSLQKLSEAAKDLKSMGYTDTDIVGVLDGIRRDGYIVGEVTATRAKAPFEVFRF